MRFVLDNIVIWRQNGGVISREDCWCATESGYLYIHDTLEQLLQLMTDEWRQDQHLA